MTPATNDSTTSKRPRVSKRRNKTKATVTIAVQASGPEVGTTLRQAREAAGLTLADIELRTRIRGKYLRWLEAGEYKQLPHDIYSKGFVQKYARALGLDADALVAQYVLERGGEPRQTSRTKPRPMQTRLSVTSRWLVSLAVLAVAAAVVGYLTWQFSSLTAAPRLTVSSPAADGVVLGNTVEVTGKTSPGADMFLNDAPLLSDASGSFRDQLQLQAGINTIRLVSRSKLGKQTTVTRNLLSKQSTAATLPPAVFAGVAVQLQATNTTHVTVKADGQKVFSGVVSQGAVTVFTAKDKLEITADNASALEATLTNSVVASAKLGPLASNNVNRSVTFTASTAVAQ